MGQERFPILPQTAVLSDANGTYVMQLDRENKVSKLPVTVAGTRNAGVIVAAGLSGSERIVTTAGAFLQPGEVVRVAEPADTAVAGKTAAVGEAR